MKIEKTKPKKGVSELPLVAKELTDKLRTCTDDELVSVLRDVSVWRYGKCELYHWVDVLDRFDEILEEASTSSEAAADPSLPQDCIFMCQKLGDQEFKTKVVTILNFTALLIEHSYARHIYNSTEHLFALLGCPDLDVVLAVLNLFYVFSKRSNFISRLSAKKRSGLNSYLEYLGETWGGKQSGFGLAECCRNIELKYFPPSCTSVFFKYQPENVKQEGQAVPKFKPNLSSQTILLEKLDQGSESIPELMKRVTSVHKIPLQSQMQLLSRVRLAKNFPNYNQRLKCILARLQALSILVYSVGPAEIVDPLIYDGFVEELVEVLESKEPDLMEIKAAVLRTLTAIIHLERDPKLAAIVESTGASAYHGFLPTLVRDCVASFTSSETLVALKSDFPLSFNTALFSFLYHLATYETSGDALVTSGIMESLLQVLGWKAFEPMNITLVTRAVRVIDLVTGLDMSAFHSLGGWDKMLVRLEIEVGKCREEAPLILSSDLKPANTQEQDPQPSATNEEAAPMDTDEPSVDLEVSTEASCMPERAALIKSILNFLKKAIPEPTFAENIRNFVDSSLPQSLKHIVSNAEYYGPSIYLPATEVTTVFIFQEPSQLSSLQDNGLPGVVLNSIITKRIPATREVLASLPNILSAMCLNSRGLQSFIAAKPFDHLFSVLVSPVYLPAMRKKKGADQVGDTASSLGVAMDELMRHQPALRKSVIAALIRLLKLLVYMGSMGSSDQGDKEEVMKSSSQEGRKVSTVDPLSDDHMSADSDVDEDDEDEESESGDGGDGGGEGGPGDSPTEESGADKSTQPLTEYVVNVIRFLDAILTNNSTKDHTTEFIKQGGLKPMIHLLSLPSLPLDFPSSHGFNAITNACRGILHLTQPSELLAECLSQLSSVLTDLTPFLDSPQNASTSVLLKEVGPLTNVPEAIKTPQGSPLLHKLAISNAFMQLFVFIFKACHNAYVVETREACLKQFSSPLGKTVLQQLSKLYKALVWEGFILLAVADDEEKKNKSNSNYSKSDTKTSDSDSLAPVVETMDTSAPKDDVTALSSDEVVSKLSPVVSREEPWVLVDSLKHLTPLLTITSRVGSSLAELMNLLIRIAITPLVRNPHRRERYREDTYVPPSEDALQICDEVTLLLVDSLQWEVPMPQDCSQAMESSIRDWLFAGMTFKMYAVDFCELLLFDEHKQVYHMVLCAFDKRNGLEAYISTFHMALKVINEEEEGTSIYGSSVDFLEAWLNFAEKLLNTSAIISSPHSMAIPPHEQMDNKRLIYNPMFNPLGFFVKCQKAILPCLKALWNSSKLSKLTIKVIELLLATIRHYYRSEEPLEKKLDEYIAADKREDPLSQLARVRAEMEAEDRANRENTEREREEAERREREANEPPAPPRVDPHHLQQLCDMGFTRKHAEEALEACGNDLNAAMEWILTHPSSEDKDSSMTGLSEEEQISRAIALSLVNEETEEQKAAREEEELKKKKEEEEKEKQLEAEKEKEYDVLRAMDKSILEDFSNVLLPSSVDLAAAVPESVYRVCDLIVSMAKRNGDDWWCRGVERVKNTVLQSVEKMTQDVLSGVYVKPKKIMEPLACQLQLLSLIFEEMPVPCARVACEPQFLTVCLRLLEAANDNIDRLCSDSTNTDFNKLPVTPKWIQALLTFLDIWGKTLKIAKWWRPLRDDCIIVWQWFENSRWCSYSHDLGQYLEKSYLDGDHCYSVRSSGRSRYESFRNVVLFDPMLQVNTETGTVRPVIRLEVARSSRRKKKEDPDKEPVPPYKLTIHDDGSEAPCIMTEEQSQTTLKYCVSLLSAPIDPSTLNATMRLCLRLTRQPSGATVFIKAGGPQALLSLKSKSGFKGFSALTLNILRHCFEDEATLARTMEYIVKSSLTTPSSVVKEIRPQGNGMKDYHYVLRRLAPIACRNEELFTEQTVANLRVTSKIPRPESYFVSQRPSPTYLKVVGSIKIPEAPLTPVQINLIQMLVDHLCSDSFPGEPFSKGTEETEGDKMEDVNDAQIFRGTRRTGSRGTSYRRQQTTGTFEDDDDDMTMDGEETNLSRQASSSGVPTASSSPTDETQRSSVDSEKKESENEKLSEIPVPLLSKAATLKLLAEILDSFPQCAKVIMESSRVIKITGQLPREMTVLAFIFDYLIPCSSNPNSQVQNIAKLAKSFVHCVATANFMPDIITILVVEFKAAFLRALSLPESQSKHNRIRSLTSLLNLVTDYNVLVSRGPVNPGQFARILIRKGLISDMTKAVHCLDLTSPLLPLTMNSILKPLEALTRIVNQVTTTSHQYTKIKTHVRIPIPAACSEPVTSCAHTIRMCRNDSVAASSPAVLGRNTTGSAGASVTPTSTAGTSSATEDNRRSESSSQDRDIDLLDATHESLVPLEEEVEEDDEQEEHEEEEHAMDMERDQLMDTVASLAHGIGRAHRQRDPEDMDAQGAADVYSSHSESDGHPGALEDYSDVLVEDESISDEDTDSEHDEAEILEDGCNSAGEEVEDEEFDESHLESSHAMPGDEVESDLSDADSTQDEEEEEDTEVEEGGESEDEHAGDSLGPSEDGEEDNNGPDDSYSMDLHATGDTSGAEGDLSYMVEEENSDVEGEDELELEYDFEDDIGEELDYFVDMPWGWREDGDIASSRAGGASFTRAYHSRPGQQGSADLEQGSNSFAGQTIPLHHSLMVRTSDHSSQLAARVRSGSVIPYETPMPIGGTGSQSAANQPESAMHQLLANISVASGTSDGLVYGVGTSGAQRIRPSQSSQEQSVDNELEHPVIPNALARWEETSSVLDGPGAVHCMHELRDVIKPKWGEIFVRENPKDSSDDDSYARRRAAASQSAATTSSTTTSTTTQQEVSSASASTSTPAVATAVTSSSTTLTGSSRLRPVLVHVPTPPHPSDQVTPSSPRDTSTTVDQLRSSLRQVADALAQTVAAVRTTREQLLGLDEGADNEDGASAEAMETREELETIPEDQSSDQGLLPEMDNSAVTPVISLSSSTVPSVSVVTSDLATISDSITSTNSSSHPIMSTFDGSQESAVASLASTNPEDPLYTFLSAVAGAPAPPTSDSTPTTLPTQTPPTTSDSGAVSPRLPVFAQFQQQSSSDSTMALSSTTDHTPTITQSAIRTPVIQDLRSTTSSSVETATAVSSNLMPSTELEDVQSMEHQTQAELTAEIASDMSELPDLASQVSSFFTQNPTFQNQSTANASSSLVGAANLADSLAQDLVRAVAALAPSTEAGSTDSQSMPTTTSTSTDLTSPPSSQRQSLQSPSPSDTLAPLLISSLQLPSNSGASTTAPTSTSGSLASSSSVIHDHPHFSTTQTSTTTSSQGTTSSLSSYMLTPTTNVAGPSLSVTVSNVSQTGASSTQQSADNQQTPETSAIDPTFLAALPHSIRREVLAQHRREQRVQQPPQDEEEPPPPFQSSISPEFLAALPPNIQTEVMQQERLERARQQGTNPTNSLDNSSFFRNLPSDLRRTILSDLDESVLNHLPEDLAVEARRLHQERESRRRQLQEQRNSFLERMMEEAHMRAELSGAGGGGASGGIPPPWSHHSFESAGLHYAVVNLNPYALIDMPTYRPDRRALAAQAAAKGEPSSKQMLDPESLACVLVLLFLDHNRLHINRLHRIIKNVCQHVPTRAWVLSSLLEIIKKLQLLPAGAPCPMPPMLTPLTTSSREGASSSTAPPLVVTAPHTSSPHWLNININAALGSHAQVFQLEHSGKIGVNPTINIHPLASMSICNNVLDLLVFLARQFQSSFLPVELLSKDYSRTSNEADCQQRLVSMFWNILIKLDGLSSRKGKGALRIFQYTDTTQSLTDAELFESSILGQLISLFSQDIFQDSVSLTDKLLRVLSVASTAIPKAGLARRKPALQSAQPQSSTGHSKVQFADTVEKEDVFLGSKDSSLISPRLLRIVVSVLISGRCSEDGLDDATSLLTSLSKCSIETRESILVILLEGVRTIGQTLAMQVSALFDDLVRNMESLIERKQLDGQTGNQPETSKAAALLSGVVLPSVAAPDRHVDHSNDLHLPSMVPLTCKGSQQSFFLRMLKVVCQLRESAQSAIAAQNKATITQVSITSSDTQGRTDVTQRPMDIDRDQPSRSSDPNPKPKFMLQSLSLQLELEELWSMLSDCLDALGKTKDSHAVLVLQPLVEAFFLVHADSNDDLKRSSKRRGGLLSHSRAGRLASYHTLSDADLAPGSPAPAPMDSISPVPGTPRGDSELIYAHLPPDIARFLKFAEKHRTVLNQILRQSTVPLSEGPFSVLVQHTRVLDFDIKRRYFRHELDQSDDGMRRDDIVVHIRRDHIFEDSFRELYRRSAEDLKGNLYIQFEGEEGQDVGGLLREWYLIIAREMFNPNYALFQLTPGDRVTYIPNPLSHVNPNHLNYFKFIGRVIAKAIYDNKLLDCYFTRSFYKHILGKPVHFTDIEAEDYAFYQGMVYLLEHDYNELGIDLNFTTEVQEFGKTEVKELKPDGQNMTVTEANKREYVQLACQMKMTGSIQAQIKSFLEGFYEVIPKDLISIFNEQELELLISGLPTIDIDDLKANTEYHKYTEGSLQIQWFWRALRSFDQADRARFLQFVTGTSKVPLQGFAALEGMNGLQKFQIHRDDRSTDRLPCAHTCFNQLDLPPYPTYDKLYEMLLTAVRECPEGFGLA